MALTDRQLEIISDAILPLFQYLEKEVIADVAKRIKHSLAYTRTAELKAESMQRLGYSPAVIRKEAMKLLKADSEFRKIVAKNTLEHKKEVRKLLKDIEKETLKQKDHVLTETADMSYFDDLRIWKEGGKELTDDSFLPQLVRAAQKQTAETFHNLTGTTGFNLKSGFEALENLYVRELDKAMIKVCTGTYTHEQVVYEVVHDLAASGLRSVDFSTGYKMQLDTAVKLAMRTGAHQLAGKVTDENINRSGENLVYVSKHWGARNTGAGHANHEQWQGKVYFIKEGQDYSEEAKRIGQDCITDLWYATGYSVDGAHENDPLGLEGYNCRHRKYPWFIGISELPDEDPEPAPVTINGKEYDYYAVTQKMRAKEREIRALKREREALKSLNMDTKEVQKKISNKIREYNDFCKDCKVNPQINRLRYEAGTSDLKQTRAWMNYFDLKANNSFTEYRVIDSNSKRVVIKERLDINNYLAKLPRKVRKSLDDITFCANSNMGSGYSRKDKRIYLAPNITAREFYHEVGHHLEAVLFDENIVDDFKRKLVQGLSERDIIIKTAIDSSGNKAKIFLLKSDRFINAYQSRLYIDSLEDALNGDGSINIDALGEVVSVAVEHYFTTPKSTKKHFPDMYRLVEECLRE